MLICPHRGTRQAPLSAVKYIKPARVRLPVRTVPGAHPLKRAMRRPPELGGSDIPPRRRRPDGNVKACGGVDRRAARERVGEQAAQKMPVAIVRVAMALEAQRVVQAELRRRRVHVDEAGWVAVGRVVGAVEACEGGVALAHAADAAAARRPACAEAAFAAVQAVKARAGLTLHTLKRQFDLLQPARGLLKTRETRASPVALARSRGCPCGVRAAEPPQFCRRRDLL